ncbi:E3 ubiquitin-protein ligase [Aureococcus anophagefferens]|uniref:RING-type E3 ubiquitin transferase n=2 Tax=Aureococcus anophagefferens TaxID=44056 RepID=A0ABR1FGG2_AURAN
MEARKRSRDSSAEPSNSTRALREMLQCPVCYCMMAPPITQCQQGHALCSSCYACVGKCPTCRVELPEAPIRSLALEQLAASLRVPCKHAARGCGLELEYAAFAGHVACCEHRPFRCPFQRDDGEDLAPIDEAHVVREMERYIAEVERAQEAARAPGPREPPVTRPNDPSLETSEDACAWEGGVDEIVDHLVHCHGVHVERSRDVLDDGVRYLLEDAEGSGECTWGPWLARDAAGRAYLLRVEQRNGAIFAAGQLVASDEDSRRAADEGLVLKLTAFSPKRNVSYESPPTSLRSDFRHLRRTGDGLWLSRGQVQLLGERPPARGRPPPPGAKPVRLTLWFEIVGAGDGDDASLEGTNATHYADETRGARCDTDADLERALAPMHVSAAREADDAAAAPKRGELA